MMLYENEIEHCLERDKITSKTFSGAHSLDEAKKKFISVNQTECMIINTHPRALEGEHWLACVFWPDNSADFFDSYGNSPATYSLGKWLKKQRKIIRFNTLCIQSQASYLCGYYAMMWLLFVMRRKKQSFYANFRSSSPQSNDNQLKKLIKQYAN